MSRSWERPIDEMLNVYYVHPLLGGPLSGWQRHFDRVKSLGFSHACVGPIFAAAAGGDIFLTDDFEKTNPALQADQDADVTARRLAEMCGASDLRLLLDIVLDRVAAEGTMGRSAAHWFYRNAGSDVVDPRQTQLGPEGASSAVR